METLKQFFMLLNNYYYYSLTTLVHLLGNVEPDTAHAGLGQTELCCLLSYSWKIFKGFIFLKIRGEQIRKTYTYTVHSKN